MRYTFNFSDYASELLPKVGRALLSVLVFIGNLLFFSVAIWFIPHEEFPFGRRSRRLDEAFKDKRSLKAEGSEIESDYDYYVRKATKRAEAALSEGLNQIRDRQERHKRDNFEDWRLFQHRYLEDEKILRQRVDEIYRSDLEDYRFMRESLLTNLHHKEKAVASEIRDAQRSTYC
jgi:hypothetical protein